MHLEGTLPKNKQHLRIHCNSATVSWGYYIQYGTTMQDYVQRWFPGMSLRKITNRFVKFSTLAVRKHVPLHPWERISKPTFCCRGVPSHPWLPHTWAQVIWWNVYILERNSQTASFRKKQNLLLALIGASETKSTHLMLFPLPSGNRRTMT